MIGAVLTALLSHWRKHPIQLATLLTGLALATGLWVAVQAINSEARASYAEASRQLGPEQLDELRAANGRIGLDRYVMLRRAGWQLAAVLEGDVRIAGRTLSVMGVDLLSYPQLPAIAEASEGAGIAPVDALTAPGRIFAKPATANLLVGKTDLPPVIASEQVPPNTLLTDIGVAEVLLGMPGEMSRVLILPDQPAGLVPLTELAPDLQRHRPNGTNDIARLTDSFHLNLTAFGLLAFAVGLFIVHGAVGLALEQRRGMIRTLRALGVPLRLLNCLIATELILLACVGGLLGLCVGYFVAGALLPEVAATLRGLYGAPVEGGISLRPFWIASGMAMAVAGTLVASGHALWRIARMPLLAAPGHLAWSGQAGSDMIKALAGSVLVLLGVAAVAVFDTLLAGFALLAGILMGAALLLPPILSQVLRFCGTRATSPVAHWVWADMRSQLPGLSLALMALLLALAANIGVGTMVSSFRLTFNGWLDQRLTSELYATTQNDEQGAQLKAWLEPRVDAILPIRSVELNRHGAPLFLYGIVDHSSYRENWPLIAAEPSGWDRVMQGEAILINEQLARRDNLWPGTAIDVMPDWELPIVGVYSDYGNPTGQAIVSMDLLLSRVADVPNRRFGIRVAPERADTLAQDMQAAFDLPSGGLIHQAELKAYSRAVFENTFVVTGALNLLTLAVAGFAILTSLLTLWSHRLPQLAPVWALGLTRAELARLEIVRSLALAAMTAVLALPLGLVLAWALLVIINVEAFGWRLPMYLFPMDWVRLFLLALLAAGLAALIPARRLHRLPPSDLLKVFANER